MKSHDLTAKYHSLPEGLRARLVGEACDLPDFGTTDPASLTGYRFALITTHGPELPELHVPVTFLRERGAVVDIVTQDWVFDWQPEAPGMVVLAQWLAVNVCVQADKKISNARVKDYDGVIVIGGAWNPIMLRTDGAIMDFIRDAWRQKRLIASICHGPQVLISAGVFPLGTRATCVKDVRIDLSNAGFTLPEGPQNSDGYDQSHPVVYDGGQRLITSPNPNSLKEFCEEINARIRELEPVATVSA